MGQIGPKLGQAVFGYSLSTFRGATAITGPYRGISGHASRAHCRGRKISLDEPLDTAPWAVVLSGWARSSTGESTGLISRRLEVRILPGLTSAMPGV
jgi:hypothetical protein